MRHIAVLTSLVMLTGCMTIGGQIEPTKHPQSTKGWADLFAEDLSDAHFGKGIWFRTDAGELSANRDNMIFTTKDYDNFVLDIEFKAGPNANSGVAVHCSNTRAWIPNSVEIQIQDDFGPKWQNQPTNFKCGGIFGHVAPTQTAVKKAGEWNRMTITCVESQIDVVLNGIHTASMDMTKFTDAKKNPDGSKIPPWLSKPVADLPSKGKIGFQGKHGGAPIFFRNMKIKELPSVDEKK